MNLLPETRLQIYGTKNVPELSKQEEETMKKLLALALAAVMAIGVVVPAARTEAAGKDVLVLANTAGEPGNVHPYDQVSIGGRIIQLMVFDGFVTIDKDGVVQPSLAESWEVTEDSITFHFRQDVTFTDGQPMTMEDIMFSVDQMVNHSTGGQASNYTACDIDNMTATDDWTLVIPMKEANSGQLGYFQDMYVVEKKAYEEMGDQYQYDPVATGAFEIKDWVVGDHITLTANPNYFKGAPQLKQVIVRTIGEVSQAMIEVETGGADVMNNPDGADLIRVLDGDVPGVKAVTESSVVFRNNNLQFNHDSQYFGNVLVRRAVAYAIDREAWTPIISPGNGVPAYNNVAAGIPAYDPDFAAEYPYPHDVEKAKELMAEAGFADGFTAVILTDNRAYHQALIELLIPALAEIGIKLDVQTMELNKQKEIMSTGKDYDLYLLDNVGNNADALSALWRDSNPEFSGDGGSCYQRFTLEKEGAQEYRDILYAIRACVDDAKRAELCKQMQRIFAEWLPWVPVNSIQGYVLAVEELQDIDFLRDIIKITYLTHFE